VLLTNEAWKFILYSGGIRAGSGYLYIYIYIYIYVHDSLVDPMKMIKINNI